MPCKKQILVTRNVATIWTNSTTVASGKQALQRYKTSMFHANSIGKFDSRRRGVIVANTGSHLRVRSQLISARYVAVGVAWPRNSWESCLKFIERASQPSRDPILYEVAMLDLRWVKLKTRFRLRFRETLVRLNHSRGEFPSICLRNQ